MQKARDTLEANLTAPHNVKHELPDHLDLKKKLKSKRNKNPFLGKNLCVNVLIRPVHQSPRKERMQLSPHQLMKKQTVVSQVTLFSRRKESSSDVGCNCT